MAFKSLAQMRKCFASHNPNWDCSKWSHETPNIKDLPEHKKKKQMREFIEFLEEVNPTLAKELKGDKLKNPSKEKSKNVYELKKKPKRF
jgi:benzoyl-CoA reductase/2-hydroxyglutaryl-CoA dehydratase subunit BcrC/BadD/HgdB